MAKPTVDIISAIRDKRIIGDRISQHQEVVLRTIYGLPLQGTKFKTKIFIEGTEPHFEHKEESALEFYTRSTGRVTYAPKEYREAGVYPGARAGKSDKLAGNIAIYEAYFRRHNLSRGERALFPVIAFDKKQAGIVFNYIKGKITSSEVLSGLVENIKAEEIELNNGVMIGVYPCSFRSMRGYSTIGAVCDEIAIWRDESTRANPANEVIRALRRGMATFPEAKLIKISSPFAKSGVVWEDYEKKEQNREKMVVFNCPSWEMNPSIDENFLIGEYTNDPEFFWREFGGKFWDAVSGLLPAEKVESAIVFGVADRPYRDGPSYKAAIDVAFKYDNFTFSICHKDGPKIKQNYMRAFIGSKNDPISLENAAKEIAMTCRAYRVSTVWGDQFCAQPVREALLRNGIDFKEFVFTANSKQAMYTNLRALFIGDQIEILDDINLIKELKSLEAIIGASGTVKVQASSGNKDDRATALALSAYLAMEMKSTAESWINALSAMNSAKPANAVDANSMTQCADCGRPILFGEAYVGLGPGLGQCEECQKKGAPTYKAVLQGPHHVVPIPPDVVRETNSPWLNR